MSRAVLLTAAAVFFLAMAADAAAAPRFRGIAPLAGQPPVVLVDPETAPCPILIRPEASPQEKQAAGALAQYLSQISGAAFSVATAGDEVPDRAVLVGPVGFALAEEVSAEGFVIRSDGQRLQICGGSPHATRMAVFALLEEQLGCRWWSHDEEEVPRAAAIRIAAQDTHVEPAFKQHDVFNREAQSQHNGFAWKLRTVSRTHFTGGHNLCPLLKSHAEQHPEFLPMNKEGERKFNNLHMNYAAAGMDAVLAEVLAQEVHKRKGELNGPIYFAGMGDWYGGMDLSPRSQRIYEEEAWTDPDGRVKAGYTATLLRMINRTAERLEKDFPGIQVGTFAYMSLEAPPSKTRPRDNVAIRLPRLRHDTVRSVVESEKNQSFRRNLDRWAELAPGRLYIWEYGANFRNFLPPFPCLRSIAENIKYYHGIGVAGVSIQGNYVSTGGDLAVLKNYVWAKLLWDPTRDVDELIDEFCRGYYGPAAAEMLAYVDLLEGSVRGDAPISADEFNDRWPWMTDDLVAEAQSLFARALAKTAGDDSGRYFRRVKEAEASLEAWLLWKPGPLVEQGDRLIRADLGQDTQERAENLVKYVRNASPREWGSGLKYRMNFLSEHSGPLVALEHGPLTVKVAPRQDGRIRAVLHGQQTAIEEARVRFDLGSVYYDLTGHDRNRLEMQADLGVGMWSPASKQTGYQTVALDESGTLHIGGELERRSSARNRAAFETVYQVGKHPEKLRIEYENDGGQWQRVEVDSANPEAELPAASRLRIERLDRKLRIDDRYEAVSGTPAGSVEYDAKTGTVKVVVRLNEVEVAAKGRTPFGSRQVRVEPVEQ